jgi:hypothetical protein
MTGKKQEEERADRNHGRSEEAHWQVAEAGAEEEERLLEAAHQSDNQQDNWENEGGALATEPKQIIGQGHEKPVPKRETSSEISRRSSEPEKD